MRELQERVAAAGIPIEAAPPSSDDDGGTPPVAAPATPPDNTELKQLREELETTRRQSRQERVQNALTTAATAARVIDPALASQLLQQHVVVDNNGALQVIDPVTKTPRLNPTTFAPLSISELLAEFSTARPYLILGDVKGGVGSSEQQRSYYAPAIPVSKIFGRGSDARAAAKLMKEDPERYRAMKKTAKEQGLI